LSKKIKKFLHWESYNKPHISLSEEFYAQLKVFRLPLILTVLTMLLGTMGYMVIDNFTLQQAIYQTGITFTTVGFGEMAPISPAGRYFTITLIILGFATFSLAIGTVVNEINKGDLYKIIKERDMLYRVARLKKHFVICYHNEYTIEITKQLRENHIPFVVVDPRKDLEEIAKEHKYPYYISEEPHSEIAMLKTHLSSAKGVMALSDNVANNIALVASIRLFEKEYNIPKPYYIMTNALTTNDAQKLKKLGADGVVTPTRLTAQRMSAMASRPDMENLLDRFLYKKNSELDLEEVFIPKYSWMVLKKLKNTHLRDITNVAVVGITQKDGTFITMPRGDTIITSESKLLIMGTSKDLNQTKKIIRQKDKPEELQYV